MGINYGCKLIFQVTKKDDGALTVTTGLTFDSAHKDNGDMIGKYIYKRKKLRAFFEISH
jgi:hypothetical protein